jgi:hypothetical protein
MEEREREKKRKTKLYINNTNPFFENDISIRHANLWTAETFATRELLPL